MGLDGVERFSYFQDQWQNQKNDGRSHKMRLIIFILLMIIVIFLLLYLFILKGSLLQKSRSVEMQIKGLEKVVVGEEKNFSILIFNKENSELIEAQLLLNFPEKFKLISSEPACSENSLTSCVLDLAKIGSGLPREIKLKGYFFATGEEKISLNARLSFRLENFSSWFKKEIFQEVIFSEPAIDLIMEGPTELINGEEGEYRLKIKNNQEGPMTTTIIISGQDFNFLILVPIDAETVDNGKKWKVGLAQAEEKTIDFSGYFSGEGENKNLVAQLGFMDEKNSFFSQIKKDFSVNIAQPGLVLGIKANGSFLDELNQSFGDEIAMSVSYKNISQEKIFEPTFRMKLEPSNVVNVKKNDSWQWLQLGTQVSLNNSTVENEGQSLSMVFSSPEIIEINPGEEGEISFNFKIKNYEDLIKEKLQNLKINLMAEASAKIFKNQVLIFNVKSNQINININSRVKLEAEARYFSDEGMKIGGGPLPPKVGQTTTYFIYLRPVNSNNALNNIKIIADLPKQVEWFGEQKFSHGNLSFDAFNKKIIWQIDSLPAYSGGSYSFVEASFKIGLTPEDADLGQVLNLLENINLTATDALDGTQINIKADNITPLDVQ